jgi:hypothetical protein
MMVGWGTGPRENWWNLFFMLKIRVKIIHLLREGATGGES